ncbi:ParB/RepB/Spo0J family partition protein [Paraburkholderia xenovorans]
MAGQRFLPRFFPADTPDLKIRMYQVSENVDRKGLSLRETSTGLAADVERFGREEASRIWTAPNGKQRSASWISKHLRFQKYGPITRELFDANQFDDIEAANKMADIEDVSAGAAAELAAEIRAELRAGRKIGRLAIDARLNALKQQTATEPEAPDQPSATHAGGAVAEDDTRPPLARDADPDTVTGSGVVAGRDITGAVALDHDSSTAPKESANESAPRTNTPSRVKHERASSADPKKTVVWRVEEIYETGTGSIERLRSLQADLTAAGVGSEDREWRLWVAFVDIAASALVGMEPETASKILNRFSAELNSRGPLELLNRLHPTRKTGVMPDDFRYDTDREIHPLAPGDWTL